MRIIRSLATLAAFFPIAAGAQGVPRQQEPLPAALTYELGVNAGMALAGSQARNNTLIEWLRAAQEERDWYARYAGFPPTEIAPAAEADKPKTPAGRPRPPPPVAAPAFPKGAQQ